MPRSDLLRSGSDLLAAIGRQDVIASLSDEVIRHLSLDQVLNAFHLARESETRVNRQSLAASGSLQKYRKTVAALTKQNRHQNPFKEYERRGALGLWNSKNTRQSARSALVRHAAERVETLANLYLQDLLANVAQRGANLIIQRAYRSHFLRHATGGLESRTGESLAMPDIRDLGRAVCFLINHPPHAFGMGPETQKLSGSAQTRKTKRKALTSLNRHQSRKQKTDASYDWRSNFWNTAVLHDMYLSDHLRACIAVMMITGCRPSELSERHGVTVEIQDGDNPPAVLVSIQSSKTDRDLRHADFGGGVFKPPVTRSAFADKSQPALRGQPWRQMRILCRSPEALWLVKYIEQCHRRSADGAVSPTAVQLAICTPDMSATGDWLHPSERDRRVTVKLDKLITRLGKIAFPRLETLTPYLFRHAVASDLKSCGHLAPEQIACALGHRSTRTASNYGSASPSGNRPGIRSDQIQEVAAPEPVRRRRSTHPTSRATPKLR